MSKNDEEKIKYESSNENMKLAIQITKRQSSYHLFESWNKDFKVAFATSQSNKVTVERCKEVMAKSFNDSDIKREQFVTYQIK